MHAGDSLQSAHWLVTLFRLVPHVPVQKLHHKTPYVVLEQGDISTTAEEMILIVISVQLLYFRLKHGYLLVHTISGRTFTPTTKVIVAF